jgi:hypothetical protein
MLYYKSINLIYNNISKKSSTRVVRQSEPKHAARQNASQKKDLGRKFKEARPSPIHSKLSSPVG